LSLAQKDSTASEAPVCLVKKFTYEFLLTTGNYHDRVIQKNERSLLLFEGGGDRCRMRKSSIPLNEEFRGLFHCLPQSLWYFLHMTLNLIEQQLNWTAPLHPGNSHSPAFINRREQCHRCAMVVFGTGEAP
jgi:hypothetical protein